ncbi:MULTISPECIES: YbaB/EbfC family nucleoid-associated protein [Pseudothermotoga]|uniref:Nucleoid-associated protein Tlet_0999 n=1 Tax=Pseudothermotoga lettingae (strain ATCC BAA-301 / DSM 14385 / NBRC 107922 / TMO) TaxID=416591 RepID=Y999_PSELT|nr:MULTISPECIES: YbaB/EbfC family nucleoid-associated protein [Pseudothermotoga]A8F5Y1.1 RecName: Full=Nucleoid-associated protein Tlet_0999 [Pseudothermotoga lettingae TMO]ABV33565.1 conserved hypothetical protein 103 [Pseudothermotoga lettingae TMO]KUK20779.1 MAG: Nucleoid-associated protein [Pseudothermotoga lettingae]MDI3494995.1 nucleoid-associated protein EbfC [Pseudothermotoga sp.]MDK2883787.1 nucleoid-associated protein EbfC [Pseudothermotoga sp.]GLI49521.1 nucleoid-associated protein
MKKIKGFGGKSYGKIDKSSGFEQIQQKMRDEIEKLENSFENIEVSSTSGGGAVKVTAKCNYEIVSIEYEDSLLEDREMFNDLIVAAINEALREVTKKREEELSKIVGLSGLPGL